MKVDWLKITGVLIGIFVVGIIAFLVFSSIWARVGIGAALVVLFGAFILAGWVMDRREKARHASYEQ